MAGDITRSCAVSECRSGTKAITYSRKDDFYYSCPTMELAAYTNTLIGIAAIQSMTGTPPNISPTTGEPEVTGATKTQIDSLRSKANVSSFDQAVALCTHGKHGIKVTVANNHAESDMVWVSNDKTSKMFWMPKSHLDAIK
jgi:hypothetical protein